MRHKAEDWIGETCGIFEILDVVRDENGTPRYKCKCIKCGWIGIKNIGDAKRASTCQHVKRGGGYQNYLDRGWINQRLKSIFNSMKERCYNTNRKDYNNWGGKGIKICDKWIENPKTFERWALDNGYNDKLTIDRIDSNGDYCPENCRWITLEDNAKYKSTTRIIDVNGELHTGRDWSKILGFGPNTINRYIRNYGIENTTKFIGRVLGNPELKKNKRKMQTYYDLYMS